MNGLATALWILTALGGAALALLWARAVRRSGDSFDPGFVERGAVTAGKIAPHAALAVGGLLVWAAAATVSDGEAGTAGRVVALVMLVVGMGLGTAMFLQWRTGRDDSAADGSLPLVVVVAHGLLAVATLVVAVVATVSLR